MFAFGHFLFIYNAYAKIDLKEGNKMSFKLGDDYAKEYVKAWNSHIRGLRWIGFALGTILIILGALCLSLGRILYNAGIVPLYGQAHFRYLQSRCWLPLDDYV